MKKFSKILIFVLASLIVLLSVLPYLVPISSANDTSFTLPFKESRIESINGVSIHYCQWIPEDKIKGKILLIHGLGGSTFSWRNNVDSLTKSGYMVVSVDLPGFGYSDRAKGIDHSQKNRSQLLWNLIDKINLSLEPDAASMNWFLAGHSMGGGTATAMTLERPDKTKALILVDGAVLDNNPGITSYLLKYPPLTRWVQVLLKVYAFKPDRIKDFLSSAYGRTPSVEEVQGYLEPFLLPGATYAMIDLLRTAASEPVEKLNKLNFPVMAIWGSQDTWVPIEQAISIQKIVPRMTLIKVDGAVHCAMETHADNFNQQLILYLKGLD